jgi:hypothetical protein
MALTDRLRPTDKSCQLISSNFFAAIQPEYSQKAGQNNYFVPIILTPIVFYPLAAFIRWKFFV